MQQEQERRPIFLIRNSKALTIFCCCTARFVSDLVRNPKDRCSHDATHIANTRAYSYVIARLIVDGKLIVDATDHSEGLHYKIMDTILSLTVGEAI